MRTNKVYKAIINNSDSMVNFIHDIIDDRDDDLTKEYILLNYFNGAFKERLVYISNNKIRDLERDTIYQPGNIINDYLTPINILLDLPPFVSKTKMLKLYKDYLLERIKIRDLYVGDVGVIHDFELIDKIDDENGINIIIDLKIDPIFKNHLFLNRENVFTDLETGIKYKNENVALGTCRVINTKPFVSYLKPNERFKEEARDKILIKYREKFKENYIK